MRQAADAGVARGESQAGAGAGLPALAAAEARRFWRRPWLWLWVAAAVAFQTWVCLWPKPMLPDALFNTLCKLAAWVPAWLCADLLAVGFRGNPEPLRQWRPREFAARALGRLAPFWLMLLVWAGTWTARIIAEDLKTGGGGLFHPPAGAAAIAGTWLSWTGVFVASGLLPAALAALASATGRRPRSWVIAPLAAAAAMGFESCVIALFDQGDAWFRVHTPAEMPLGQLAGQLLDYAPNLWTGYLSAMKLGELLRLGASPGMGVACTLASFALVVYALPPFLAVWAVAHRRRRGGPFGKASRSESEARLRRWGAV